MRLVAVLAVLLWVGAAQAAQPGPATPYKVGLARRDVVPGEPYDWRQDPKHALAILIWYPAPAGAREKPAASGPPGGPAFDIGPAAADASLAPSPEKFPLIVLSHGFGGLAANMGWLGRALAAGGYIAAAVDHPRSNMPGVAVRGAALWRMRPRDLSAVIDGMLKDPLFGPRIDPRRIGAAGYSAGGYTVIELAGGVMSRARFRSACAAPDPARQCPHPSPPSDSAAPAAGDAARSYRDPRVRAVFAIAPGFADAFLPDSLSRIDIPAAIVAGAADAVVPAERNAEPLAAAIPHARLTILPAPVGHLAFAGGCVAAGPAVLPEVCGDPPGVDRAAVEATTAALAEAFFAAAFAAAIGR